MVLSFGRYYRSPQPFRCCRWWWQSWGSVPSALYSHTFPSKGQISFAGAVQRSWPWLCFQLLPFSFPKASLYSRIVISSRPLRTFSWECYFIFKAISALQALPSISYSPPIIWVVIYWPCWLWVLSALDFLDLSSLLVFAIYLGVEVVMVSFSWSLAVELLIDSSLTYH